MNYTHGFLDIERYFCYCQTKVFFNRINMKIGRYLVGLLSGLTFGLLFAPKKGSQLRAELVRKGGESGQEAIMVLFNAFRDAGVDAVGEMKKLSENEQLRSALNMSKEKMHEYLARIEDSGYDLAAQAQEKVEQFSEMASSFGNKFKSRALEDEEEVVEKAKSRIKKGAATVKTRVRAIRKSVPKKLSRKR